MRDTFSKLIDAGITRRTYEPIAPSTPSSCPLCRVYNNIWGILSDTHMSEISGFLCITGTLIGDQRKWEQFVYANNIGGYNISQTGYCSLHDFFYRHCFEPWIIFVNGQPACRLIPRDERLDQPSTLAGTTYVTTESKMPQPLRYLLDIDALKECLKKSTIAKQVEAINDSSKIPGSNWSIVGRALVGGFSNHNVIIGLDRVFESEAVTISNLFGTLQESITAQWRKHLQSEKNAEHEILDAYYKEMPELIDALIEAYQGSHEVVDDYENILPLNLTPVEYLTELKRIVTEGRELMDSPELESLCDDILVFIDSTLYKLKNLVAKD